MIQFVWNENKTLTQNKIETFSQNT